MPGSTYFAPSYFGLSYFGGALPTSAGPPGPVIGSPYFSPGYFCPGFFGPSYFAAIGYSPILPEDLPSAIVDFLKAQLVPDLLTWIGAGLSPPGTQLPYAIVGDPELTADWQEDGSDHPPYDDNGDLIVTVIASSRESCQAILLAIDKKSPAGLNLAPLLVQDGQVLMIRRTSKGYPVLEDEDAPLGQQAWVGHLNFATIESKNL